MKSSSKCFDVFEFKEEHELEMASSNFAGKFNHGNGNPGTPKTSSANDDLLIDFSRHAGEDQLNCVHQESNSSEEVDDLIPDADRSPRESSPSTSSYNPEDNVPLEGHGSFNDGCFCILQKMQGDRNVAVVCPDYIVYRGIYSTKSLLTFSSQSLELKDFTCDGDQEISRFVWEIDDIVKIQSQWSKRLEIALVELHVLSKDAEDFLVEVLRFAVVDLDWHEKLEEIMSLDIRYKVLWDVAVDSETGIDEKVLPGSNGAHISRIAYFPNFTEPFGEVVYPRGDPDAVSIGKRDVDMLQPDTFVNDTIIDFYIKYLKNKMQLEERNRFHFFNSFFFRKLIDLDKDSSSTFEGRAAFQRVRKWTRKVNLFEKDYVFIPVNYSLHWSLIVICHPGEVTKFQDEEKSLKVPCILHMDSLKGSHTSLKDLIQSYLWEEWKEKNKEVTEDISAEFLNLRFVALELPQQPNMFDCGLFLLHYVERFLEEAPINFSPFRITDYSNFLNPDWFPPAEPSLKRAQIQMLICKILEGENSPPACSNKPCDSDYPSCSNAIDTDLEFVSRGCSPLKNTHGDISGAKGRDGVEMTLSPTSSSQYIGDSSLVLGDEAGATDGKYQTSDQAEAFDAMGRMEENVEPCGRFVNTELNIHPGYCGFPHEAEHDDSGEYPETSICGSSYSSEVEVQENKLSEKVLIIDENIDQSKSPLAEMFDVAGSQSCDLILSSHGSADDLNTTKLPKLAASYQGCGVLEGGYAMCDDNLASRTDEQHIPAIVGENFVPCDNDTSDDDVICETPGFDCDEQQVPANVSENLVPKTDVKLGLASISDESIGIDLVLGTDEKLGLASICNDSAEVYMTSESDGQPVGKRTGELLLESDEQQPTKRSHVESVLEGDKSETSTEDP